MSFPDPTVISASGTLSIITHSRGATRGCLGVFVVSASVLLVSDSHFDTIRLSFTFKPPLVEGDHGFRATTVTIGRVRLRITYFHGLACHISHIFRGLTSHSCFGIEYFEINACIERFAEGICECCLRLYCLGVSSTDAVSC